MTAPLLLTFIGLALLLQLALAVGWAFFVRGRARGAAAAMLPAEAPKQAGAWVGWREFRVVRRSFEDEQQSQCSFYLEPVDRQPLAPFQPGQFLTFQLPAAAQSDDDAAPLPRSVTRCYSLSDQPDSQQFRITVKRVPAPANQPTVAPGIASNHWHDHVPVGAVVSVKAPAGHFHIDPESSLPAVLLAGGIGITPMISMLQWLVAKQPQRTVDLYYGVRHERERAFREQLEELARSHPNFHLHLVCSQPASAPTPESGLSHQGHVDVDLLKRTLAHGRHQFYLCGPAAMMESLVPALRQWGVPPQDIHFEAFGPASVKLPADGTGASAAAAGLPLEIHFTQSGRTLSWDGQDANLLDFAQRHNIAVDSGCRSGGCGSCETRLLEGSVQYAQTPDHEVAPGHCLLCVGKPQSALVLAA